MKRDMDLLREILLEIEACPHGVLYDTSHSAIDSHARGVIDAHLAMLNDAGFLFGFDEMFNDACCAGLTMDGYEFLEAARAPSVWKDAKAALLKSGVTVTLAVFKDLLVATARRKLGL